VDCAVGRLPNIRNEQGKNCAEGTTRSWGGDESVVHFWVRPSHQETATTHALTVNSNYC
jgi:hypothetical protein